MSISCRTAQYCSSILSASACRHLHCRLHWPVVRQRLRAQITQCGSGRLAGPRKPKVVDGLSFLRPLAAHAPPNDSTQPWEPESATMFQTSWARDMRNDHGREECDTTDVRKVRKKCLAWSVGPSQTKRKHDKNARRRFRLAGRRTCVTASQRQPQKF